MAATTGARVAGIARAGDPQAIDLGRRLFFERRLSIDGTMSCATCHQPLLAFADARKRSQGRQTLDRNAPSLWNAVHERWYGWDGAADSLWAQSIRPILHAHEMDATPQHVRDTLARDAELSCRYRQAFGHVPEDDPETVLVNASKAIGAFVSTLVSGRTKNGSPVSPNSPLLNSGPTWHRWQLPRPTNSLSPRCAGSG